MPKGTESILFTEQTSDDYLWGQQAGKFGRFPALYFKGEPGNPGATGNLLDATLFSGSNYPAESLGRVGDVYLKYDDTLTALVSRGLRIIRTDEIATADDLIVSDLNGSADAQYWFLLYGYLTVGGDNRTISILPNGDATAGHYHGMAEVATSIAAANATTATTYLTNTGFVLAQSKYNIDNYVRVWGCLSAYSGVYRLFQSDSLCVRTDSTEGLCRAQYQGAWLDTATNISSLTLSFGGASDFAGIFNLYTNR